MTFYNIIISVRGRNIPHITQIAAIELASGASFNSYVRPKLPITLAAQEITGIVVNQSGPMTVKGQPVEGKTIRCAISEFLQWLNKYSCVVLVAHNGRKFDFPVFLSTLKKVGSEKKFFDCVTGLIDSLPVFKKVFPNQDCYKQEHLVKSVLQSSYLAHDAMEDVKSLGQLMKQTGLTSEELIKYTYPPLAVHNSLLFSEAKARNIDSLGPLIYKGVLKRPTAENIAGSGLNMCVLRKIFLRSGEDGLRDTFMSCNSDGLPRVTSAKRTLDDLIPKLAEFFSK